MKANSKPRLVADESGFVGMGAALGVILAVITLVIGLRLLPVVTSSVADCQSSANVSSSDDPLCGLITTIYIIGLVIVTIALMFVSVAGKLPGLGGNGG